MDKVLHFIEAAGDVLEKANDSTSIYVQATLVATAQVMATLALVEATERQTRALVAIHNAGRTGGNGGCLEEEDYF